MTVTVRTVRNALLSAAVLLFLAPPMASGQQSEDTVPFETIVKYIGGSCNRSIQKLVVTEDGLEVFVRQTCLDCPVQPANVNKPVEIIQTERLEKTIRKKDPKLVVELQTIPCKPPDPASN